MTMCLHVENKCRPSNSTNLMDQLESLGTRISIIKRQIKATPQNRRLATEGIREGQIFMLICSFWSQELFGCAGCDHFRNDGFATQKCKL